MNKYLKYININDISYYRQTLMGLGIFGVMFSHWFGFQGICTGIPYMLSDFVVKLVFTEGFLFLSGFGLYYSFSTKPQVADFYKRRMIRLYIPFFLLSFPLYFYFLLYRNDYNFYCFISQITTAYFWLNGNYGGMWYVSLSVVLYFLFPLFFHFCFHGRKRLSVVFRTLLLLLILYVIIGSIHFFSPVYYAKISIGIDKVVYFILGMVFAYVVKNNRVSSIGYVYVFCFVALIYIGLTLLRLLFGVDNESIKSIAGLFQKLFFIPFLCVFINVVRGNSIADYFIKVLNWFGKYSLELYILHLHFFMFFKFGFLSDSLSSMQSATLALCIALILCAPTKLMIASLVNSMISSKK